MGIFPAKHAKHAKSFTLWQVKPPVVTPGPTDGGFTTACCAAVGFIPPNRDFFGKRQINSIRLNSIAMTRKHCHIIAAL